ncbi:MAG: hypothetical protein ACK4F9_02050 [Brevinematia bacterium]
MFGILEREGKVGVEIVLDVTAETLFRLAIKKVNEVVYSIRFGMGRYKWY